MSNEQWLQYFDENSHLFRWFFDMYFERSIWDQILTFRAMDDRASMLVVFNDVWFNLPDNRFNIMENPKGWSEFLHLLEN